MPTLQESGLDHFSSRSLLLLTQQRSVGLNNTEIVAIGHWARKMHKKSRLQRRDRAIVGKSAQSEIIETPLFGLALTMRNAPG